MNTKYYKKPRDLLKTSYDTSEYMISIIKVRKHQIIFLCQPERISSIYDYFKFILRLTSGLVIFAKTKQKSQELSAQITAREGTVCAIDFGIKCIAFIVK